MMTNKEILRKSIVGVIEQGKPSVNGSNCMYRSKDGLRCAVGMIIEDEHYDSDLENKIVTDRRMFDVIEKSIGKKPTPILINHLYRIQRAHDIAAIFTDFVDGFKDRIKHKVNVGDLPKYCLEFIKGTTG